MVTAAQTSSANGKVNGKAAASSPSARDLPTLRHGTTVAAENGRVVLRHNRDEVTLEGAAADLFTRLQGQLDGRTAIDAIAQEDIGEACAGSRTGRGAREGRRPRLPLDEGRRRADDRDGVLPAASRPMPVLARGCLPPPLVGQDHERQGLPRPGDWLRLREIPLHRGRVRAHGHRRCPTRRRR